jgi:hypothetical protein
LKGPEIRILRGDSLDVLKELEPESIHAIVTDPPYGMSAIPDIVEVLSHWLAGDDYQQRGGGFMGKTWDSFVPGPAVWKEVFRVLKPGGHILAFSSTRTADLLSIAIRIAGFHIRDTIGWSYGSGFPKSLDVSKAIDRAAGAKREKIMVPTKPGNLPEQAGEIALGATGMKDISEPVTQEAKDWDEWGTALTPSFEPIVLARKPFSGSVYANVLEHGTGAINVDGCKIGNDKITINTWDDGAKPFGGSAGSPYTSKDSTGRWPKNLMHDEYSAGYLDAKAGKGTSRFFYVAKASREERDAGLSHLPPKTAGQAVERKEGSAGQNNPRAGAGRTGGKNGLGIYNSHPT